MEFDKFVSMWWFVREFKKEKKNKKKGKCQKEENKNSSHQILRSEM